MRYLKGYRTIKMMIKGKRYMLWVADTDHKKKLGLSGIKRLPPGRGMIFTYNTPVKNSFTMKNTSIPLTIIFLDEKMNIIDVFNGKPFGKSSITPEKYYKYVIEI